MAKINVSVFTKTTKLRAFQALLDRACPHDVTDLCFVQQSHNAAVFRGVLDGQPAFFKAYEDGHAQTWTQSSALETKVVAERMVNAKGGVGRLLWSSVPDAVIAVAEAPGQPVTDTLDALESARMRGAIGEWLRAYVGETAFEDRFSTAYWMRKRRDADLSGLEQKDAVLATALSGLQSARAQSLGTVACLKGETPRDFAPWNLHWTGHEVWGFDLEGHVVQSVEQALARFCVLSLEQSDGLAAVADVPQAMAQLCAGLGDGRAGADFHAYLIGDILFERFVKWAGHSINQRKLHAAVLAHLEEG